MTSGVIEQKEHKEYQKDIDGLFSETSMALSDLVTYYQFKHRVSIQLFLPFYTGFFNLFIQTAKSKYMQNEQELIEEIDKWMDYRNKVDETRIRQGIELFKKWGTAMEKQGIHTIT
jgi:hypothetical protein